ncbi:hypothetical protein MKEN_00907300 [Mycena kentingensis (nom. inval.)]|nr:hypothetical protein MKEN_00907300 [Mycena kentingensis (nom. inval.)]
MTACAHSSLSFEQSSFAQRTDYSRPNKKQRTAALPSHSIISPADDAFCAPLILPGDDLAEDPEYPPQSFREWLEDEDRNEVTPSKRTLYVVPPPAALSYMTSWSTPKHAQNDPTQPPEVDDVAEYLSAFYHGLPVKVLSESPLRFTSWDNNTSKSPRFIGLQTSTECIRIRTRASKDGTFQRQLNLDDLLDVAISILPKDAFALLLLVPYDIYENADDDFACGRAYGGSRVAVISTARYHPALDDQQRVSRDHAWPASHCTRYMEDCCTEADAPPPKKKKKRAPKGELPGPTQSPLHAAVAAHSSLQDTSVETLSALWLSRACKTASHELGHCLGIDHCVYYACIMQGTASLAEDARQPPFLCPIDHAKLLHATTSNCDPKSKSNAERDRNHALLAFCDKHPKCHLLKAFAAWIRAQQT